MCVCVCVCQYSDVTLFVIVNIFISNCNLIFDFFLSNCSKLQLN